MAISHFPRNSSSKSEVGHGGVLEQGECRKGWMTGLADWLGTEAVAVGLLREVVLSIGFALAFPGPLATPGLILRGPTI